MKRREFLTMAGALGLVTKGSPSASAQTSSGYAEELGDINSYFLEPGLLTPNEEQEVEDYLKLREEVSQGSPVRLRGRPKRAPTYRLVYWEGALGDVNGKLAGPLSVTPELEASRKGYRVNAQILNSHLSSEDWKEGRQGLLSVDLLAKPQRGRPKTWQLAETFDVLPGGRSSLGFEYIVQDKDVEVPVPLVTSQPNLGVRFQLMRVREGNSFLKKVMKVAAIAANPSGTPHRRCRHRARRRNSCCDPPPRNGSRRSRFRPGGVRDQRGAERAHMEGQRCHVRNRRRRRAPRPEAWFLDRSG